MARRNESIFELLIDLPWWVSVIFSLIVYIFLGIVLPSIELDSPAVDGIRSVVSSYAMWIALFFLIPAPLSLLKKKQVSKRGQRRQGSALDILFEAPWWVTFALGVFTFAFFIIFRSEPMYAVGYTLTGVFLIAAAMSKLQATRKSVLLEKQHGIDSIKALDWKIFEDLVGEAYRRLGYQVAENTAAGADGGVDLRLEKGGRVTLVQCKQWRNQSIGVKTVREMLGIMVDEKADEVIIACTGSFTQEAINFATDKPIQLITGTELQQLVTSVQTGSHSRPIMPETRPIKPTVQTAESAQPANTCPRCGSNLVLRIAKRGANAGSQFYGCGSFPKCRYTVT